MSDQQIETVQKAFEQFEAEHVRVPDEDNEAAKLVHPQIRETLRTELDGLEETFLSGSYARKVQADHLKDVDIVVVLSDPDGSLFTSADKALEIIRTAAKQSDLVDRTKKNRRSVRLFLKTYDFMVDLVAGLERFNGGEGLLLAYCKPDEGWDGWKPANPKGQLDAATKKNKECGGMYIPAVRLVKYWLVRTWGSGEKKSLRSYHAEAILHGALASEVDFDEAMVLFFDAAWEKLAPGCLTEDPGCPGIYVDEKLEDVQRLDARQEVELARAAAHVAFEKTDIDDALNGWAKVFGSSFPATDTSSEKLASALKTGTAGIVGSGVQVKGVREVIPVRSWRRD